MPRKTYRKNWVTNLFSIFRLFMVIPFSNAKISFEWEGRLAIMPRQKKMGFSGLKYFLQYLRRKAGKRFGFRLEEDKYRLRNIQGHGKIYIPFTSKTAFISDIDDTFLISSFIQVAQKTICFVYKKCATRMPFEGVVNHYQLLACSGQSGKSSNPFFYVSGSEWNLYDFIVEFSCVNKLPEGVFLLSQLKRIKEFWKSGQNNLTTKFMRIVRIFESYPHLQYVLLGDDSQQDPAIYLSIVSHFPDKVIAVYIRRVHKTNYEKVKAIIEEMQSKGVSCCYFEHSSEAIIHSKKIGLIV